MECYFLKKELRKKRCKKSQELRNKHEVIGKEIKAIKGKIKYKAAFQP